MVAIDFIRENAVFQQDDHLRRIRSSAAALDDAEHIKVMDEASSDSSFIVAQTTNGMDRRQDRRGGRAPGGVNHGPCGER